MVAPTAWFALLTPAGRGAVATLSLAGPDAFAVLARCFTPHQGPALSLADVGRVRVGRWGDGANPEELVVAVLPQEIAIHPHAGLAAVEAAANALAAAGAERVPLEVWAQRCGMNVLTWEARLALGQARTAEPTRILLEQGRGALRNELQTLLTLSPATAAARVRRLAECSTALRLTAPWRVVLAGKPNAGKSSLLNALVGFQRAITHAVAGTTRDVVTAETALAGWPIEFRDTAGLRETHDELEAAGVARAHGELATADLILFLVDVREAPTAARAALLAAGAGPQQSELAPRMLVVRSQADRLPPGAAPCQSSPGELITSAVTGQGVADLQQAIVRQLLPHPPEPGAPVAFTPRQHALLRSAAQHWEAGDSFAAQRALQECLGLPSPPERPAV